MRPQQNNNFGGKRSRGRNRSGGGGGGGGGGGHNHNKPQNILHRSFESTGPDMKVRGTAQHVYEKYLQLARDANSSGDRVMAENYLQHAEHYYRIIAAAQAAMTPQQREHNAQQQAAHNQRNGNGHDGDSDGQGEGAQGQGEAQPQPTEAQVVSTRPPPVVNADDEQPVV